MQQLWNDASYIFTRICKGVNQKVIWRACVEVIGVNNIETQVLLNSAIAAYNLAEFE